MKKFISIILTLAVAASLTACSNKSPSDASGDASKAQTNYLPIDVESHTVEAIKEKGTLSVATESLYAPFCFKTKEGEIIGLEPDFMQAYADYLGVKLDIQDIAFDSVVPSVQSGIADMGMAGLTPDAKRKESVDFTDFYFQGGQNLVVKADKAKEYNTKEALDKKIIGAQKGSTQQKIAESQFTNASSQLLTEIPMLILELKNGNLDGVLLDKVTAEQYVKLNSDLDIAQVEIEVDAEENGSSIAVMKGNTSLIESLNEFIKMKTDDGTISQWYVKYDEIASKLGVK